MTIDETIEELERLIVEKKDLDKLLPKDRLNFWSQMMEFRQPKIQRSVFEPINQDDFKILIEYANDKAKTHKSIQRVMDKSKED